MEEIQLFEWASPKTLICKKKGSFAIANVLPTTTNRHKLPIQPNIYFRTCCAINAFPVLTQPINITK